LTRTKTTTKPSLKIITSLLTKPEMGQYQLPKETKLSYRTILRELTPLKNEGLIKLVRTEPSIKGGKEKNIFAITDIGLLNGLLLKEVRNNTAILRQVAKAHSEKMRIFMYLPEFEKAGVYLQCLTQEEISGKVGVSQQKVSGITNKFKTELFGKPLVPESLQFSSQVITNTKMFKHKIKTLR